MLWLLLEVARWLLRVVVGVAGCVVVVVVEAGVVAGVAGCVVFVEAGVVVGVVVGAALISSECVLLECVVGVTWQDEVTFVDVVVVFKCVVGV